MKNFLLIIAVSLCLAGSVFGQYVTTISEVQDTTGTGSSDSPLLDSLVTVVGVVSAESWAYYNQRTYYIQDGSGPWSGVMVYEYGGRGTVYGDSVRITAIVTEYNGMTELTDVTEYEVLATGATVEPTLVTTGEIGTEGAYAEAYEGVLVQVVHVDITDDDLGYGEWEVDDGSGPCRIDDETDYYFTVANYDSVRSITGNLNYAYGDTKIEPRLALDVVEAGKYTRIQRIQQVRYSDLLKTPDDEVSDHSYLNGETVTIKGVVTMPTGLSWAGLGIKFIFSELEGGPWSGILSYDPDSTAFPRLLEGDVIEATGYIAEYHPGSGGNMTEFFITSAVEFIEIGQPIPDPDYVTTGDLRLPVTAEQWGTGMVYIKDAAVVDLEPQYELFEVDDGTGGVLVDADSDSLTGYPDPPMGSIADSIRGWVYHHYGVYADSTTYKLEPLYTSDIVWGGGGPPALTNVVREPGVPTASDAVTVSVDVATELTITTASLYYRVDNGDYSMVPMTAEGETYSGQIPAQVLGSWVDYYVSVTDDLAQTSIYPTDLEQLNLSYPVTDGNLTISNIQYTPWEMANSPFEDFTVDITGVVTVDSAANGKFGLYSIQEAEAPWSGVFVYGINTDIELKRGDEITVSGTVTEHVENYDIDASGSQYNFNTTIIANSHEVISSGNSVNPIEVTTGDLNGDTTNVESYEGVHVKINIATFTDVNRYDVSFDDGSGKCLVDGDFMVDADNYPNDIFYLKQDYPSYEDQYLMAFGDTLRIPEIVEGIQGIFIWSYGSYKIEVRDANDFGEISGIDSDYEAVPLSYQLHQNFPNPFNPDTQIRFEIPKNHDIAIVIYNMLGQKIRTLVKDSFKAGRHVVNWDGQNDHGLQVPTGMYIYRIKAGEFMAAKKMVMIK